MSLIKSDRTPETPKTPKSSSISKLALPALIGSCLALGGINLNSYFKEKQLELSKNELIEKTANLKSIIKFFKKNDAIIAEYLLHSKNKNYENETNETMFENLKKSSNMVLRESVLLSIMKLAKAVESGNTKTEDINNLLVLADFILSEDEIYDDFDGSKKEEKIKEFEAGVNSVIGSSIIKN